MRDHGRQDSRGERGAWIRDTDLTILRERGNLSREKSLREISFGLKYRLQDRAILFKWGGMGGGGELPEKEADYDPRGGEGEQLRKVLLSLEKNPVSAT